MPSTSSCLSPQKTIAPLYNIFSIKSILIVLLTITTSCYVVTARKHHLEVRNDMRPYIALSTFGFYTNGHLDVELSKFTIDDEQLDDRFGLSLDKTTIDQMNPYLDSHQNKCILEESSSMQQSGPILFFVMDLKNLKVNVQCSPEWKNLHIYKDLTNMYRRKRQSSAKVSDTALFVQRRRRRRREAGQQQPAPAAAAGIDDVDPSFGGSQDDIDDDSIENVFGNNLEQQQTNAKLSSPLMKTDTSTAASHVQKVADTLVAAASSAKEKSENVAPPVVAVPVSEQKTAAAAVVPASQSQSSHSKLQPQPEPVAPVEQTYGGGGGLGLGSAANFYESTLYKQPQTDLCNGFTLPLHKQIIEGVTYYNMTFSMFIATLRDEGLYNLYFHACPNYKSPKIISFNVDIEENNNGNFLSAGEMPLPALYFMMSLLFFLSGLFWVFILKKSKHTVYKIHYIMAVLVFLKSLSLMFHSINYHFIEKRGEHVETWAILYYIAHLLKGAVLFITIVLIGTGWTFIKHILSDKDKKIFMIVIPLQVLANVAQIITDESDQSDAEFRTWRNIFFFVDLLCCGAILFPIVWSIRHLHEASATDGKAAINLRKLKLFRQFYIMIVCYIYFTRIIVDLLQMTVVFQYAWLDEMFREMATYVFFVLTGYKFRPVSSHPYFTVPDDDADDEVEVLTGSGLTETIHRTKPLNRNALHTTKTIIEGNDDEREILIAKRESSHEYD